MTRTGLGLCSREGGRAVGGGKEPPGSLRIYKNKGQHSWETEKNLCSLNFAPSEAFPPKSAQTSRLLQRGSRPRGGLGEGQACPLFTWGNRGPGRGGM